MAPFLTGRIHIHPQNASLWKESRQLIIGLLRPRTIVTNTATGTIRAGLRNILGEATVVAIHGLGIHMQGQRNVTVGTGVHRAAFPTHDKARITSPVEHENRLLALLQTILNSF